jgi:hypothetical protein
MVIATACLLIAGGCTLVKTLHRAGLEKQRAKDLGQDPVVKRVLQNPVIVAQLVTEKRNAVPTFLTNEERAWIAEQPGGEALLVKMAVRDMVSK